ncbi:hypothetical protein FLK61_31045 [Paenalkalicoccus suaedae]|uniref:DAGKc domain-containing protein n=1 Tax=Paenalkalicoccus suaedae TaxID=2592382 RepID=A0A859FCT0_9BACI|nr:diacylglycerol kinase family protein [Paenalkalicoccus suaedae]QKS71153.1 hypothetical protein FLK61_31045 [Paenalkalicoccus suaedae]
MHAIILNNSSNNQVIYQKIVQISSGLSLNPLPFFLANTSEASLANLKQQLLSKLDVLQGIIILGGDGTLQLICAYLHDLNLPFGIIRAGSGNDFARALRIPKHLKHALQRIASNSPKKYDTLYACDRLVLSVCSAGADALTAKAVNESRLKSLFNKAYIGRFIYIFLFMKILFTYKPQSYDLYIDDKKHSFKKIWLLAVGNTPYYGGGVPICPSADPCDQKATVTVVDSLSRAMIYLVFPLVYIKKHVNLKKVHVLEGEKIEIVTDTPIYMQGDGELLPSDKQISIKTMPANVSFY